MMGNEAVEEETLAQKMARAEEWIKHIRELSERTLTPEDKQKLLTLADAAGKLFDDTKEEHENNVATFLDAARDSLDVRVVSPLLSFDTILATFSFLIKNLWNRLIGNYTKTRSLSDFRSTKEFGDQTLAAMESTLPGIREEKGAAREKKLEEFFGDRTIAGESEFEQKGDKESGVSEGYLATKQTDPEGLPFMIKVGHKYDDGLYGQRNRNNNTLNFVNELITAALYKRTLYDRTPLIAGVESDPTNTDSPLLLRSKFLHDFQTISQFTNSSHEAGIGWRYGKLKQVQGAEKLFANILAWGESDIHAGNTGVMKVTDEAGEESLVFAKIDHGWSASQFFTTPDALLENFATAYKKYNYAGIVPLKADKLKQAIDQITTISDEEIETLVKSRILQLKELGFEIENLAFMFWEDDKKHLYPRDEGCSEEASREIFNDFDDLENHYIDHFKQQMKVMREVSNRLDIISKIDYKSYNPFARKAWENGKWLQMVRGEDPIEWARQHNMKIDGLTPDDYVAQQQGPRAPGIL